MRQWLSLLLVIMVFSVSPVVLAQSPVDGNESQVNVLDEIFVTATKTDEKIRDIPTSTTVRYGEDLQASGIRTVGQYLQTVPGINFSDVMGNGSQFWGSMRGLPAHNSRYLLVLVDGIPRNDANDEFRWYTIPIEMVERIEIVRGPASALYGRNAMGGVINIITRKAFDGGKNQIAGGLGSYNENKVSAFFQGGDNLKVAGGAVRSGGMAGGMITRIIIGPHFSETFNILSMMAKALWRAWI